MDYQEAREKFLIEKFGETKAQMILSAPPGKILRNRHQCRACCLKHLATALVVSGEIKTGYDSPEYHLYLLGNLTEAQEQIALRDPVFANRIRAVRMAMFGDGGTAILTDTLLDDMTAITLEARTIANSEINQADTAPEATAAAAPKPGCGCRKRSV